MNKKSLIAVLVFVAVSLGVAVISFRYIERVNSKNVRGDYMFAATKNNMENLQTIKLSSPEGGLTIYRKDGVWHFKEAGDYYVNAQMLKTFFKMVNQSIIMTVQDEDKEFMAQNSLLCEENCFAEGSGLRVQTYEEEGDLLDDVIIGQKTENPAYRFARQAEGSYVYGISNAEGFNGNAAAWVPFPLLQIPNSMIEALVLDGKYIDRELLDMLMPSSKLLKAIMDGISYFTYDGIVKKSDFIQQYAEAEPHTIKVEMVSGLIYVLDVYFQDEIYWLAVRLENVKIPQKDVIQFVQQNQKYYADWLFMMNEKQGKLFYNIRLR